VCREQPIDVLDQVGHEQRVKGMIDTGSKYSLMNKKLAVQLKLTIRPLLESRYIGFHGVNGSEFHAVSFVRVCISLPNLNVPPTFLRTYIIETQDFQLLLGTKAILKLNIFPRINQALSRSSTGIGRGEIEQCYGIFALFSSRNKGSLPQSETST
jgi:hypothetical protein